MRAIRTKLPSSVVTNVVARAQARSFNAGRTDKVVARRLCPAFFIQLLKMNYVVSTAVPVLSIRRKPKGARRSVGGKTEARRDERGAGKFGSDWNTLHQKNP